MSTATATSSVSSLRQVRLQQKLSLDELGHRARVERTKLGRAERGYARLTSDELRRVARVLRLPVRSFSAKAVP